MVWKYLHLLRTILTFRDVSTVLKEKSVERKFLHEVGAENLAVITFDNHTKTDSQLKKEKNNTQQTHYFQNNVFNLLVPGIKKLNYYSTLTLLTMMLNIKTQRYS